MKIHYVGIKIHYVIMRERDSVFSIRIDRYCYFVPVNFFVVLCVQTIFQYVENYLGDVQELLGNITFLLSKYKINPKPADTLYE